MLPCSNRLNLDAVCSQVAMTQNCSFFSMLHRAQRSSWEDRQQGATVINYMKKAKVITCDCSVGVGWVQKETWWVCESWERNIASTFMTQRAITVSYLNHNNLAQKLERGKIQLWLVLHFVFGPFWTLFCADILTHTAHLWSLNQSVKGFEPGPKLVDWSSHSMTMSQ